MASSFSLEMLVFGQNLRKTGKIRLPVGVFAVRSGVYVLIFRVYEVRNENHVLICGVLVLINRGLGQRPVSYQLRATPQSPRRGRLGGAVERFGDEDGAMRPGRDEFHLVPKLK